jgi:hypothetical protein
MLRNYARWPEPNAGWRDGMCVEAYLALDFFRSFCIKAKRTKEKLGANTFEVLVSYGEPNELIQRALSQLN